ncbi:MGMT family protein [Chondromyces crocatus]|nr:MGMT family protein [Chondromyces crocatus]
MRAPRREAAKIPETVSWWAEFYEVIRRIPRGRVCTYGAVAAMAGHPRAARHVGHALSALGESGESGRVPWQRVLGSRSRQRAAISIKDPVGGALQRALLEAEGVAIDERGGVSLDRFGWFESGPVVTPRKKSATQKGATKTASTTKRAVTKTVSATRKGVTKTVSATRKGVTKNSPPEKGPTRKKGAAQRSAARSSALAKIATRTKGATKRQRGPSTKRRTR